MGTVASHPGKLDPFPGELSVKHSINNRFRGRFGLGFGLVALFVIRRSASSLIQLRFPSRPIIRIRQGLTTNMSSVLTRLPTVTQIADYVQQQSRGTLDSFVGTKFLAQRTNEVVISMTFLFKQMVAAQIVGAFTGLKAVVDPNDATTLQFEGYYQPVFPLLYLVLTFNLRARV